MRYISLLLIVWFAILSTAVVAAATLRGPPNFVLVYADDLGYGDLQCYNPQRGKIATPHVDRLADEGMRFTDAHSSSAVCSPSRYTLLTGRYHWRTRLQSGIVGRWGKPLIAGDRLTLGTLARQNGYRTACIGKWHLGWDWPIPDDQRRLFDAPRDWKQKRTAATEAQRLAWRNAFSQPIAGGPISRGFDEYFGTDVPNWPPYCFIENDRTVGIPSEYAAPALFQKNQASVQGPALADWTLEPVLPAIRDRAVAFIRREAETPGPFLLYLPLTSPHTPLAVNEQWKGKSRLGPYGDLVMETDDVVGRIMATLDECELVSETLVIFTSDNGCAPYIGVEELERKGHFPSGPWRGYKSDVWEGGHRVPFVVRWPGVVKAGTTSDHLIHQADVMATLAGILGAELPANAGEDSFNLLPLLMGVDQPIRQHAVSCSIRGLPSLRHAKWKFIPGSGSGGWSKGGDQQTMQLYDLNSDPDETENLAASEVDRVGHLSRMLEQLIAEGRSNPGPAQENDVDVTRYAAPTGK